MDAGAGSGSAACAGAGAGKLEDAEADDGRLEDAERAAGLAPERESFTRTVETSVTVRFGTSKNFGLLHERLS